MEAKQIRINPQTVDDLRKVGKDMGETTDDVTIRLILAERKQLKLEIELLKMKLEECKREK